MRNQVTIEQARDFVNNNDGYGTVRLYGVIADGKYSGQITAIKSLVHLERDVYSELYTVTTGTDQLIGRA